MSYKQEGESCGAWSLTRLQMIKRNRNYSESIFRAFALTNYRVCKFKTGDSTARGYAQWVRNGWTDPWRLATELKGGAELHIAQSVRNLSPPPLLAFVGIIDGLNSKGGRTLGNDELTTLPNGKHAIINCMMDGDPTKLHYVLITRTPAGLTLVYDSNSETLNDAALAGMPGFGAAFQSRLSGAGRVSSAPYRLYFTGLWIKEG